MYSHLQMKNLVDSLLNPFRGRWSRRCGYARIRVATTTIVNTSLSCLVPSHPLYILEEFLPLGLLSPNAHPINMHQHSFGIATQTALTVL